MNVVDIIAGIITLIFVLVFYRLGLISVLKSFFSFLLASTFAVLCLEPVINFILKQMARRASILK